MLVTLLMRSHIITTMDIIDGRRGEKEFKGKGTRDIWL